MHEHHHHRQLCTCKYHTQLFRWRFYIVFLHHTLRISLISPLSTEKRPTLNPVFAENYMLNLRLTFTQWQRRGWRQRSNHGKSSEKKSSEATKNESWLIKGMKCAPHTDSSIKTHNTRHSRADEFARNKKKWIDKFACMEEHRRHPQQQQQRVESSARETNQKQRGIVPIKNLKLEREKQFRFNPFTSCRGARG